MKYKGNIIWTLIRTLSLWLVGLMNTLFIKQSNIGSWIQYLGYAILVIALIDTLYIIYYFRKTKKNKNVS